MQVSQLLNENYSCCCGQSFTTKRALTRHGNSVHGPTVHCNMCGKNLKCYLRRDLQARHLLYGCAGFKKHCEAENIIKTDELVMSSLHLAFT